jgi:hypothetical protein
MLAFDTYTVQFLATTLQRERESQRIQRKVISKSFERISGMPYEDMLAADPRDARPGGLWMSHPRPAMIALAA